MDDCVAMPGRADGEDRDPDQAWYWTEDWQTGEREAAAEIASGRLDVYLSDEDFLNALQNTWQAGHPAA